MSIAAKLNAKLKPTGLNSQFINPNLNFQAYVATIKQLQAKVNQDYELGLSDAQLADIAPFEIKPEHPNKKGMLLIHGLFDTPFIMRDLARYYADHGFLVRSILLPGHGTIPVDLLTTVTEEWYKATAYGVKSFGDHVDEIYITGFSTGAILGLHYYLEKNDPKITKLIMVSPAFAINTYQSILVRLYRLFHWPFSEQKWIMRSDIHDHTKYTAFPVNSAYLVQRAIYHTQQLLKEKKCDIPLFIVATEDDETVRTTAALDFFKKTTHPENQFLLYTNHHHRFHDSRIHLHSAQKEDELILNFSHVCLPVSPSNTHYGREGDYQEPVISNKKTERNPEVYLGAATSVNEKKYRLRRLTYNPYFSYLCVMLTHFLNKS